jgi:hypothetical protein
MEAAEEAPPREKKRHVSIEAELVGVDDRFEEVPPLPPTRLRPGDAPSARPEAPGAEAAPPEPTAPPPQLERSQ